MTTDPPTTKQDKRRWLVFETDCVGAVYEPDELQLVFLDPFKSTDEARRDPANVLNVLAYPEVVEACEVAKAELELKCAARGLKPEHNAAWLSINAALSAVHPAPQGDKT